MKDVILGEEIGNVYNRDRLKELVRVSMKIRKIVKKFVRLSDSKIKRELTNQ